MIDSVINLLMTYFNDDRPITGKLLERKCKQSVLEEALEKGFLRVYDKDCDGYDRYVITEAGKFVVTNEKTGSRNGSLTHYSSIFDDSQLTTKNCFVKIPLSQSKDWAGKGTTTK